MCQSQDSEASHVVLCDDSNRNLSDLVKVEKIVEVGVCFGLADGCDLHEKKGLPRGWS